MKHIVFYIAFLSVVIVLQGQNTQNASRKVSPSDRLMPAQVDGDQLVHHIAYSVSYNFQHNQPTWVYYLLTRQHAETVLPRKDSFKADPMIKDCATPADYKNTGYDKGHLAPNADMNWDVEVQKECFYMSNMSPQTHAFNSGIWSRMEQQVRDWAIAYDSIYVVTGPVLTESTVKECLSIIRCDADGGCDTSWDCVTHIATHKPFSIIYDTKSKKAKQHRVSVPDYYYKVVYCPARQQAIAFLVPHEDKKGALIQSYVVNINTIELVTGIDFFPELEDEIEEQIESIACLECWQWNH